MIKASFGKCIFTPSEVSIILVMWSHFFCNIYSAFLTITLVSSSSAFPLQPIILVCQSNTLESFWHGHLPWAWGLFLLQGADFIEQDGLRAQSWKPNAVLLLLAMVIPRKTPGSPDAKAGAPGFLPGSTWLPPHSSLVLWVHLKGLKLAAHVHVTACLLWHLVLKGQPGQFHVCYPAFIKWLWVVLVWVCTRADPWYQRLFLSLLNSAGGNGLVKAVMKPGQQKISSSVAFLKFSPQTPVTPPALLKLNLLKNIFTVSSAENWAGALECFNQVNSQ